MNYTMKVIKGLRKVDYLHKEIDQLIESGTYFLGNMLSDTGRYQYGYFHILIKKSISIIY